MYPKPLQTLIDLFMKLPGIGPRQASRFVFAILKSNGLAGDLGEALAALDEKIGFCGGCFKTFEKNDTKIPLCDLCRDTKRDHTQIAVVEKESDLQNLEKTRAYRGMYHVLGGALSPLDSDSPKRLHLADLHGRVKNIVEKNDACEIILATSATTEGDLTALYIERVLAPLQEKYTKLKTTRLGRGLSLGSELEYADEMTLKNALTNRK